MKGKGEKDTVNDFNRYSLHIWKKYFFQKILMAKTKKK